jgi:hypothetical protein
MPRPALDDGGGDLAQREPVVPRPGPQDHQRLPARDLALGHQHPERLVDPAAVGHGLTQVLGQVRLLGQHQAQPHHPRRLVDVDERPAHLALPELARRLAVQVERQLRAGTGVRRHGSRGQEPERQGGVGPLGPPGVLPEVEDDAGHAAVDGLDTGPGIPVVLDPVDDRRALVAAGDRDVTPLEEQGQRAHGVRHDVVRRPRHEGLQERLDRPDAQQASLQLGHHGPTEL